MRVYGDPAGNQGNRTGLSDWEAVWTELRHLPGANVIRCVDVAHPGIRDSVNAVNGFLLNSQGQIRMKIDPKCRELMADFEQVAWQTDAQGKQSGEISKKSDPKRTHMSDCVRYAIWREFPIQTFTTGARSNVIG